MEPLSQNTIFKTITAAKQIETLKKKFKERNNVIKNDDLQPFRALCCHEDLNTAIIACDTILDLVKYNNLPLTQAISWFVTSLQSTNNVRGIIKALTELLLLSIRLDSSEKRLYLDSFQHPFVLILKQDNANWSIVEYQMKLIFNSDPEHVFTVLKRVFTYVFWSPSKTVDTCCKRGLWTFLMNNIRVDFDYFIRTICYLQRDDQNAILDVSYFLADLYQNEELIEELNLGNLLCVISAENSCKLAEHGHQPDFCLQLTKRFLKKYPAATDVVLTLFAQVLLTCPAKFLHIFTRACVELINTNGFQDVTIAWMIISALLPWIIHPISAISEVCRTTELIFNIAEKKEKHYLRPSKLEVLLKDEVFMKFIVSSRDGYWAFVLAKALENYEPATLLIHMNESRISSVDVQFNYILNLFVSGLLLASNDQRIQKSALDILKHVNAGFQLPLILFMLSKTKDVDLQLALLNALPSTAVDKNNVSPVLMTLNSFLISGQKVLVQHSVQLFVQLWKIEKRCYPYLSEELMKNRVTSPNIDREMDVVVACAVRDICTLEPLKYGKEWVGVLSDIMNRYSEQSYILPLVIALEAILKLCAAGVVNVLTVFQQFSKQRLFENKQPEVIEKLCELVELILVEVNEVTFNEHRILVIEAVETMWKLMTTFRNKAMVIAAMKTLSKFDVGLMPLKLVPEMYWKDIKLPAQLAKTSKNAKPGEVLTYVPGTVWIIYLQHVPEEIKTETCAMLASWLQLELNQLGRGFYHSIRGEPSDVSFLHDRSIFKALVKYLKRLAIRSVPCSLNEIRTVSLCLLVLNDDRTTKLPQFNWAFLDQFLKYKDAELSRLVISFFAKQCGVSMSANKGIENYITSLDILSCEEKELHMLITLLPKMSCSVAPTIFSSMLSSTADRVLKSRNEFAERLFIPLCEQLGKALEQSNLDEHNRDTICRSIIDLWEATAIDDNESLESLVDVIRVMPFSYTELIISPEDFTDLSVDRFTKILMLCCAIALKTEENPFTWLDYCIDLGAKCLLEKDLYYIFAADVLRRHRFHSDKWIWLLQFLDRIVMTVDEATDSVDETRDFLFDILIFSVVNLSSFSFCLKEDVTATDCYEYFPLALNNIITDQVSSQVIEWIYHVNKSKKIGERHESLFKDTIAALKYNKYFQKVSVWSKIFSDCY